jgi:[protein-PII] uridylyltransferase
MPDAYLLAQSAETARQHLALIGEAGDGTPRVSVRRSVDGLHDELTLAAADRPGLLWRVCGVFTLHGINILEARIYTDARGTALDVFRLADAFESHITAEKSAAVARDLVLALEGRLALGYRLAAKLRHYAQAQVRPTRPPRVSLDNAASSQFTVVEVRAPDRLGLLYTLTRALSDLHLDIHLAKVSTRGPEAVDAFYVSDLHGRKVEDPEHVAEIERAIAFALREAAGAT